MITVLKPLVFLIAGVTQVCHSGCPFTEISKAIQQAVVGDTIEIASGEYHETLPITIDRKVTLRGKEWPAVFGDGGHDVFVVTAAGVSVTGLEIKNTGASFLHELAGIRVEGTEGCNLSGNRLINTAFGIYLANSQNCEVENNFFRSEIFNDTESGNGVHSWSGKSHRIHDNRISGHRDGIYLEFTNDSFISNNQVEGNIRYGLHFMSSHRNEYKDNRFENNGAGVAVMYSRNIKMLHNTFANNVGAAAYGLLLKDISEGEIKNNEFFGNTFGVYAEGTNRTIFAANSFRNNGYGLRIFADCDGNTFSTNNFEQNTFDVVTNSSLNPNTFDANYWSNYSGYDLDRDGRGDTPYHPVSLSSVLVEKFDSTYLLIKSPLFLILDQIEQALPMLIPEGLRDNAPLMRPYDIASSSSS